MILFVKILLAHLIGDFVIQTESFAMKKRHGAWGSYHLYLHSLIHGVLALLVSIGNNNIIWIAIIVGSTHLLIDGLKVSYGMGYYKRYVFFIDQFLHLVVLVLIAFYFSDLALIIYEIDINQLLLLSVCLILLTQTSSVFTRVLISRWKPEATPSEDNEILPGYKKDLSLISAGKYIGFLERLFIFIFIISGYFTSIGFLLGAKSIFRFSDMSSGRDRAYTEYIIIGTFISFAFGIIVAYFYLYATNYLSLHSY